MNNITTNNSLDDLTLEELRARRAAELEKSDRSQINHAEVDTLDRQILLKTRVVEGDKGRAEREARRLAAQRAEANARASEARFAALQAEVGALSQMNTQLWASANALIQAWKNCKEARHRVANLAIPLGANHADPNYQTGMLEGALVDLLTTGGVPVRRGMAHREPVTLPPVIANWGSSLLAQIQRRRH